jgi:hypothetical protein
MKKLWQWLKAANENAQARAKLILTAKERMGCMDEVWRGEEEQSSDAVGLLLMRIGLAHIEAVYQGQMMARFKDHRLEACATDRKAHLN